MDFPYETLTYIGRVVFKDPFGLEAEYHTYQRLRVLQSELFAVTQRYWGWGDPVSRFVSPSVASAQLLPNADPPAILMILKKPAKYGEEIEIHSVRQIHHAFKDPHGIWEYKAFSPTAMTSLAIDFPQARDPDAVAISASMGSRSPSVSRPSINELVLTIKSPSPGSLYRADWDW